MYKISQSIDAHTDDVRCVYISSPTSFLSCSRDKTAKQYTLNPNNQFSLNYSTIPHPKYISAILSVPPNPQHPTGLILTACYDSNIRAFAPPSTQPLFTLSAHKAEVSCLFANTSTLISGSLDGSAIVWLNFTQRFILKAHTLAIWSVAIYRESTYLTASADKDIKLWIEDKCLRTFSGHSDCVRGLAVEDSLDTFLSCANDGTVQCWAYECPESLETCYGHTNYVYSVGYVAGDLIVSGGEDRSFRVWNGTECVCTVVLPVQSVWSVASFTNGDILTGSSDGCVRIFSADQSRWGSEEVQEAFSAAVAATTIPAQIGDLSTEDIRGEESLNEPGSKEGEVRLIRLGENEVVAYSWSTAGKWNKIGNVVGANESTKQMFNGREYDYVFDVELEEVSPGLRIKFPYNMSEPFESAAQRFIEENELPSLYFDQIIEFLTSNTSKSTLIRSSDQSKPSFIRVTVFNLYSSIQLEPMCNKLMEFSKLAPTEFQINAAENEAILKIGHMFIALSPLFLKLTHWSPEFCFPVIDMWRYMMAVYAEEMYSQLQVLYPEESDMTSLLKCWFTSGIKTRSPILKFLANGLVCVTTRGYFMRMFMSIRENLFECVNGVITPQLITPLLHLLGNVVICLRDGGSEEDDVLCLGIYFIRNYIGVANCVGENVVTALCVVGTYLEGNARLCAVALSSLQFDDVLSRIIDLNIGDVVVQTAKAVRTVMYESL